MMRAIEWFARNHVAANLLMLVMLVGGLLVAPTIKQELIPDVDLEMISIQVVHPGASPSEVEEGICVRVEEALEGLQGIKQIRSTAAEGACAIIVDLMAGEDMRMRLDEVRARVEAIDTFPAEAEEPRITEVTMRRAVLSVAVSGRADERTLKLLGQQVRDELATLPNVTDVEIYAARPYEMSIEVSEAALRRYGLRFDDVVAAVRRSSLDLPGGSIKTESGEILLRTRGQAYRGREFEAISLVSRADGTRLTVGDVATVRDDFEDTDQRSTFDGEPTVLVQVYRVGDQKELEISRMVRGYVDEARLRLPEGVSLTVWADGSEVLRSRLETMLRNGRGGFILVVLVLACFLRLRLALWVSFGIPTVFLGALAIMPSLDMSINIVSLLAFIVVLGIVVDDAIVVGESAYTQQLRLGSKLRGAIAGAQSIAVPVCFGVLTTVAAFGPMLFLPGAQGRLTRVVPVIVIACLVFSLLEAMFVLPAHLGHSRGGDDAAVESEPHNPVSRLWQRFQKRVDRGLVSLIDVHYRFALKQALEWRYLTVSIAISLLLVIGGLIGSGHLRFVFTTPVEADLIVVDLTMPRGTPASVTDGVLAQLERAAVALGAELDAESSGGAPPVFEHRMLSLGEQPFRDRQNSGPIANKGTTPSGGYLAEMQLSLSDARKRARSAAQITQMLREAVGDVPGVEEIAYTSTMVKVAPPIEVRLRGQELGELQVAADAVKKKLSAYPGVYDIADSFRRGKEELELTILPSGEALGVSLADLAQQVRQGFYGVEAQTLQRGREEVKVMVRYPAAERSSLVDVKSMRIRTPDGTEVPFETVAGVSMSRGFSSIQRTDRRRIVNVTAEVDSTVANANEIVRELQTGPLDELLRDIPGVAYSFEGDQADQREFLNALGRGQLIALLIIFGLLAIPLGSYLQPLIIMSAIPFGIVGAAIGHMVLGYDLNMYSVVGLVALSGIVVNGSLVLVDYIERRRAEGWGPQMAVVEGGRARFRPIMLTSVTTFAGLTPLMLETSMQARFMIPMAISISFGVIFASTITLFLVPASYLILEDFDRWRHQLLRGGGDSHPEASEPGRAVEGSGEAGPEVRRSA